MANRSFSTDPAFRKPPPCVAAPLLWSLLPLAAGILSQRLGIPPAVWMAILTGLGATALVIYRTRLRITAIMLCSFLAGFGLAAVRAEMPHPSWIGRPQREVIAEIQIGELFNARKAGRISGVGRVLSANLPVDTITGARAAFYLEGGPVSDSPTLGSIIQCHAVLRYLPHLEEPDDFQKYLQGRDIFLSLNKGTVLREIREGPALEMRRQWLYERSEQLLTTGCDDPDDPGHVLASMLLGNRSLLNDNRILLYKQTGTYHLFAVSGLHVGSVALCMVWVSGLLRFPRPFRIIPVLLVTWTYVWMTGSSPSAVRAGIMVTCISLSRLVLRQPHLFPALALSAWIVLVRQPAQLFHLGFQLSYGVVASIILIGLPVAGWLRGRVERIALWRSPASRSRRILQKGCIKVLELGCVSASAGIASAPLIIQHFERFTPGGFVAGILLNPLASACVMTGAVSLLSAPVAGLQVSGWMVQLAWPFISLMEHILAICLQVPGSVSPRSWTWAPFGTVLLVGILFLAWLMQRARMQGSPVSGPFLLIAPALVLLAIGSGTVGT